MDLVAAEYGWTAGEILDGHSLSELLIFARYISARRAEERLANAVFIGADQKDAERAIAGLWAETARELAGEDEKQPFDPRFFR